MEIDFLMYFFKKKIISIHIIYIFLYKSQNDNIFVVLFSSLVVENDTNYLTNSSL